MLNLEIKKGSLVHRAFRAAVLLKGIDGILELISGLVLSFFSPQTVGKFLKNIALWELQREEPGDFLATHFYELVKRFSVSAQHFAILYLIAHGLIKILLAEALWKERLRTFPIAITILCGFLFYQIYRFAFTGSILILALSILDIIVIWLTWLEYRRLKKLRVT